MIRQVRCWWCGRAWEVDTEQPTRTPGVVQDSDTSWICTDGEAEACTRRALESWERGEKRPSGPSLKLLAIVKAKGLDAIA